MVLYYRASTNPKAPVSTSARTSNRGQTLSRYPATPQDSSSYHPDNPRRHGSQLNTALMMSPRYVLSRVPSLDCTLFSEHTVINITFTFPFSTKPLSWVGWKTISPTMRQHSSKQIDVHTAAATSFTQPQHTHSIEFAPLASPVESSEIRPTYAARPSNIVHILSHPISSNL